MNLGKLYSGGEPEFIEGDVFRTIIPLNDVSVGVVGPKQDTILDTIKDKTIKAICCTTIQKRNTAIYWPFKQGSF